MYCTVCTIPNKCNFIYSQKERTYIESNVLAKKAKVPPAPILRMVTSRVYWVLQITHFAHAWGFLTLIAVVPTYLNNMHHLPIEEVSKKKAKYINVPQITQISLFLLNPERPPLSCSLFDQRPHALSLRLRFRQDAHLRQVLQDLLEEALQQHRVVRSGLGPDLDLVREVQQRQGDRRPLHRSRSQCHCCCRSLRKRQMCTKDTSCA